MQIILKRDIQYIAEKPTITYTAFSSIGMLPKIKLTKFKSNKANVSQLIPPTIVSKNAIGFK